MSGGVEKVDMPPPTNPLAVARRLLPDWQHPATGALTCRRWRGSWMRWTGTAWREWDEAQVRAGMYERLEHAVYDAGEDREGQPQVHDWAPTRTKISNLLDALSAVTLLPGETDAPFWTDRGPAEQDSSPIVACRNGLLRIRDRALIPHRPEFFNIVSVPYDYDPAATAPTWTRFLNEVWPEDPEAVAALQEWFGYVLSGRTDQQKILLIKGPSRSGKGTIARILGSLVGRKHVAGPTLAGLGSNFGLSSLVGKPLAVISDARLSGKDGGPIVERLLTISGEDTIDIDRKYKELWTGKLPTRLVILTNELPSFGDTSGVIARRFVVLSMTRSWLGREDTALTDSLAAEMPGILNWALDGLDRLERTGRITEPESSRESVVIMQDTASPTSAFVREKCATGPAGSIPVDVLWATWRDWAEDSGIPAGTKQIFGRNLQSVVPQLHRARPRDQYGNQVPTYTGITLAKLNRQ